MLLAVENVVYFANEVQLNTFVICATKQDLSNFHTHEQIQLIEAFTITNSVWLITNMGAALAMAQMHISTREWKSEC